MSTSVPPFGALFSFMNERWETIGWAKPLVDGGYIWCHKHEATFVIGKRTKASEFTFIAPIEEIGRTSKTRDWKFNLPDYIRISESLRVDANVGRRVRILSGFLDFDW